MDVPLSDQMLEAVIQRVRDAVEEMNDPERHEDAPRTIPRFGHDMLEFAIFKLAAKLDEAKKPAVKDRQLEVLADALTKLVPSLKAQLAIAMIRHAVKYPDTKDQMMTMANSLVPFVAPARSWWKFWR